MGLRYYGTMCFLFIFQYSFENLFRSQQYALLDASCREYHFVCDFFMLSANAAQDLFNTILGKSLALYIVCIIALNPHWHVDQNPV